jgi:hypothetical protein
MDRSVWGDVCLTSQVQLDTGFIIIEWLLGKLRTGTHQGRSKYIGSEMGRSRIRNLGQGAVNISREIIFITLYFFRIDGELSQKGLDTAEVPNFRNSTHHVEPKMWFLWSQFLHSDHCHKMDVNLTLQRWHGLVKASDSWSKHHGFDTRHGLPHLWPWASHFTSIASFLYIDSPLVTPLCSVLYKECSSTSDGLPQVGLDASFEWDVKPGFFEPECLYHYQGKQKIPHRR